MRNEILNGALRPDQKAKGYSLEEEDDFLYLLKEGKRVATFIPFVTPWAVQKACDIFESASN